jgi:hypothetical protein
MDEESSAPSELDPALGQYEAEERQQRLGRRSRTSLQFTEDTKLVTSIRKCRVRACDLLFWRRCIGRRPLTEA